MRNGNITERAVQFILSRGDEELSSLKLKDAAGAAGAIIALFYVQFLIDQKRTFRSFVEREKLHRVLFHLDQDPDIEIEALSKKLGYPTTVEFEDKFEKFILVKPARYRELRFSKKKFFGGPGGNHCRGCGIPHLSKKPPGRRRQRRKERNVKT